MKKSLEQLLIQCSNDISALEQIYRIFKNDVFAFSLSVLRNYQLAEDCVQETFVRLPRAAKKFKGNIGGREFIITITANITKEYMRRSRRELLPDESSVLEQPESVNFSDSLTVQKALSLLNANQRSVFTLRVFSDFTFEQIAKILKLPVSTVKYTYYKAVEILDSKKEAYL